MATVELTSENFGAATSGGGMVLVDLWAAWCGPCRMFGPVFERASERHAAGACALGMDEVRASIAERTEAAEPASS